MACKCVCNAYPFRGNGKPRLPVRLGVADHGAERALSLAVAAGAEAGHLTRRRPRLGLSRYGRQHEFVDHRPEVEVQVQAFRGRLAERWRC